MERCPLTVKYNTPEVRSVFFSAHRVLTHFRTPRNNVYVECRRRMRNQIIDIRFIGMQDCVCVCVCECVKCPAVYSVGVVSLVWPVWYYAITLS